MINVDICWIGRCIELPSSIVHVHIHVVNRSQVNKVKYSNCFFPHFLPSGSFTVAFKWFFPSAVVSFHQFPYFLTLKSLFWYFCTLTLPFFRFNDNDFLLCIETDSHTMTSPLFLWTRHNIAEILLKLMLNTNRSINQAYFFGSI